jgi:hypothetical protein
MMSSILSAVVLLGIAASCHAARTIELTETPVYLVDHQPESVLRTLGEGR